MTKYEEKCLELIGTTLKDEIIKMVESCNVKAYLDAMARFNNYSLNNLMLIRCQCPDATFVCAHSKWAQLGGHAKKGTKAIRILAPIVKKESETVTDELGTHTVDREFIAGWRTVPVFDVSQIEGAKLPENPCIIEDLDGDIVDFDRIYPMLQSATTAGIDWMDEADLKMCSEGCHGYYSPAKHIIRIRKGMPQAQAIKTTIHEIAHSLLHSPDALKDRRVTRCEAEMEAESTAYVVCKHFGLDTSDYSLGYITSWGSDILSKDKENGWKTFSQLLDRVLKVSKTIIEAIDPPVKTTTSVGTGPMPRQGRKKTVKTKTKEKITFVCVSKPASTGPKKVGVIPRP